MFRKLSLFEREEVCESSEKVIAMIKAGDEPEGWTWESW